MKIFIKRLLLKDRNLFFIGTINVDETTHGFADKVYDRAQLIEMTISRKALEEHMKDAPYSGLLLNIWDAMLGVAPFAFRVLTDVDVYVRACAELGISWQEAVDEQILQKILRKSSAHIRSGKAIEQKSTSDRGSGTQQGTIYGSS